ncbi:MAG: helix-turn-helix domain-containing protein [Caldilineaceae bacterium]
MTIEQDVHSLIALGEGRTLDLKLELDLDTASGKSEFVKDVISLANTAESQGYLIIGVNDSGDIVGIESLEEERIQQIAHSYITPTVLLTCKLVNTDTIKKNIGIITIEGQERPHKVSRAIDKLNQNDVFVRHGSVVMRATPEEIIRMQKSGQIIQDHLRLVKTAQEFLKISLAESALEYYSRAINLLVTSDVLLKRADVYLVLAKKQDKAILLVTKGMGQFRYISSIADEKIKVQIKEDIKRLEKIKRNYLDKAIQDVSEAIVVADSVMFEKEARRTRVYTISVFELWSLVDIWEEDISWLCTNGNQEEKIEYLMLNLRSFHENDPYFDGSTERGLELTKKLIDLGVNTWEIFFIRARIQFGSHNYGLALKDIQKARQLAVEQDNIRKIDFEEAFFLHSAGLYKELYHLLNNVRDKYPKKELGEYIGSFFDAVDSFVCRVALDLEFSELDDKDRDIARKILKYFRGQISEYGLPKEVLTIINKEVI